MPTAIASGRRGEEEKKRREAETTQNQNNNPRLSGGENAKRARQLASASCTADSAGWRSLTPCFFQASHLKGSKVHFSPATLHVNQIQRQSFLCCFHQFPLFRQFSHVFSSPRLPKSLPESKREAQAPLPLFFFHQFSSSPLMAFHLKPLVTSEFHTC